MTALPYFPMYPGNWLASSSVTRMTLEEQGAFLRLLCFGWNDDGIPADRRELALIIGCEPGSERAERILGRVLELAWRPDADNPRKLRNNRQEADREKCVTLYDRKCAALRAARARNPKNQRGDERRKPLPRREIRQAINDVITPVINTETENQNQTLLRERGALKSEPEQQPQDGKPFAPSADWRSLLDAPTNLRHGDDLAPVKRSGKPKRGEGG